MKWKKKNCKNKNSVHEKKTHKQKTECGFDLLIVDNKLG